MSLLVANAVGFGVPAEAQATGGAECPKSEMPLAFFGFVEPTSDAVVTSPVELELSFGEACVCDGGCWLEPVSQVYVTSDEVLVSCVVDQPCSIELEPGRHRLTLEVPRHPTHDTSIEITVVEDLDDLGSSETENDPLGEGETEATQGEVDPSDISTETGDGAEGLVPEASGSADPGESTNDPTSPDPRSGDDAGPEEDGAGCSVAASSDTSESSWLMLGVLLLGVRSRRHRTGRAH